MLPPNQEGSWPTIGDSLGPLSILGRIGPSLKLSLSLSQLAQNPGLVQCSYGALAPGLSQPHPLNVLFLPEGNWSLAAFDEHQAN